jgi:hypothetical protein
MLEVINGAQDDEQPAWLRGHNQLDPGAAALHLCSLPLQNGRYRNQ